MSKLGKLVQTLRRQRGYSQRELGRMAGLSGSTVSLIESGETDQPNIETLRALAKALGVSDRTLFEPAGLAASNDHPRIPAELSDLIQEFSTLQGTPLYEEAMKLIRQVFYLTILKLDPPPDPDDD